MKPNRSGKGRAMGELTPAEVITLAFAVVPVIVGLCFWRRPLWTYRKKRREFERWKREPHGYI
jgi:hypothetical protein